MAPCDALDEEMVEKIRGEEPVLVAGVSRPQPIDPDSIALQLSYACWLFGTGTSPVGLVGIKPTSPRSLGELTVLFNPVYLSPEDVSWVRFLSLLTMRSA